MLTSETATAVEAIKYALEHGCSIRLDKLLRAIGLAESVSDAARKLKQKAVKVNGELKTDPAIFLGPRQRVLIIRVGRKIKKVTLT
jgi:ribosomal protein S4